MSKKSIDISRNKIKYLALGDSIAEGYNPLYQVGFPGEMITNENNENSFIGISYPAYFAKMINDVAPGSIESFKNFSITGSRVVDWLYFLGVEPNKYNYSNSEEQISAAQKLDLKKNNYWKKRLYNQFELFGIKKTSNFDKIKLEIKQANLITITIGANDLITKIPFIEILSWKNKEITREQLDVVFQKMINKLVKKMVLLFKKIKKINPKAIIISTSYPDVMPILFSLINKKIGENNDYDNGLVSHCIGLLNDAIIKASIESGIHYVNIENNQYWKENINNLSTVFFDIHPTTKGYKNMAYQLFFKTALSNNFYSQSLENIKKIFPNINELFFENNGFQIHNILNFSKLNISDEKLIELSKLNDEKYFWTNETQEEMFLHLRRKPNIKLYINNGLEVFNSSSNNLLKQLLITFSFNESISKKIMLLSSVAKKNAPILIKSLANGNYLNNIIIQIQNDLDFMNLSNVNNKRINLEFFEQLVLEKLLNIKNILFLMQEVGMILMKLNDKNLLKLFKDLVKNLLLSTSEVESNKFIKNKLIDNLQKNENFTNKNLFKTLISDFSTGPSWDKFIINLVDSYFNTITQLKTKNFKNIYVFLENYSINFLEELNLDLILNAIMKNNDVQEAIVELIISILDIENCTQKDNIIIIEFIKFAILNVTNKTFLVKVLSKLFVYSIGYKNKTSVSSFLKFVWDFKITNFWKTPKNLNVQNQLLDTENGLILSDIINLIFDKSKLNGTFFLLLKNLKNPKTSNKTPILNILNVGQDLILKISKIENFYIFIADCLYNNYLIKTNIKNEDNEYYKAFYRFTITSLWICYKLFQQNVPISIFWNTKKGISQSFPSIVNQIYSLSVGKSNSQERAFIVDYIFGNTSIQFDGESISENNYLPSSLLWYIKTCDKFDKDKYSNKTKKEIIFESLRKGYWENK